MIVTISRTYFGIFTIINSYLGRNGTWFDKYLHLVEGELSDKLQKFYNENKLLDNES